jgi:peroxiredoxin
MTSRSCFALASSVVALSVFVAACDSKGASSGDSAKSALIGNPAPDFSLDPLANSRSKVATKPLTGKVVLVDFWATWCEPCKKSFPKLQELSVKYKVSGFEILAVSEDDDDSDIDKKIVQFAQANGAKFPIAWDKDKAIAQKYNPATMPSSFVLDRKGVVRYAHIGYHDGEENELDKEIKELLDEK